MDKLIAWAFLCSHAEINERGGLNATHIFYKFNVSELPGLALVFRVQVPRQNDVQGGLHPYPWLGEFSLGIIIKTEAKKNVETHTADLHVTDQVHVIFLGQTLTEPGSYTVEIFVDGALQHSLDLFLE